VSASKRDRCAHVSRSGTRESFSVRRGTDCCGRTRVDEGTCTCDLKSVRKTNEQKRKEGRQWKEALLKAPDTGECIRETGGAHRPSEDAGVWSGRGGGSRYADLIEDGCNAWRCSALRPLNPDSRGRAAQFRPPTTPAHERAHRKKSHTHELTNPRKWAGYLHAPLSRTMQNACMRARACRKYIPVILPRHTGEPHLQLKGLQHRQLDTQATRFETDNTTVCLSCVCPSGKRSEGGCCEAKTNSAQNGQGVRRRQIAARPRHVPFSGGVVKGKLFLGSNSLT